MDRTSTPSLEDRPDVPTVSPQLLGPGEVLVRVGAVGVSGCRLERANAAASAVPTSPDGLPATLGNEIAGWVNRVGPGVHGVYEGQPVAILSVQGCGACRNCLRGEDNYCENNHPGAVVRNGGRDSLDPFILVRDERQLVPLPANVSPIQAAPLLGAALTALHAIEGAADRLTPDATTVVIGSGAVGHLIIQALRATSNPRIVAVDLRPESLELAKRCGADVQILATDTLDSDLREATEGHGAVAVFDTVGSDRTLAHAAAIVDTNGWVGIVGLGGGTLPVSVPILPFGVTVRSTVMGSRRNLTEVLSMAAQGALVPTTTTYCLSDAGGAFDDVSRGAVIGCAVISVNPQYVFPD
jgi:alcohol dehydrogenase, propanol-preferring